MFSSQRALIIPNEQANKTPKIHAKYHIVIPYSVKASFNKEFNKAFNKAINKAMSYSAQYTHDLSARASCNKSTWCKLK